MAIPVESLERIDQLRIESIAQRKQAGLPVSEAHSETHLRNNSHLTLLIAGIFNFDDRVKLCAYASGSLHDLVRLPSEDPTIGDEEASARNASKLLKRENALNRLPTSEGERRAIAYAIRFHGEAPEWMKSQQTKNNIPSSFSEQVRFALFVADKLEQNGYRIIARRSQFVAGERLVSPRGDLKDFGFQPSVNGRDGHELIVVAIESILRLSFINPESIYPDKLVPLVHPLYEVQRSFVSGVLRAKLLGIEDLAQLLLGTRRAKDGLNILQYRKIVRDSSYLLAEELSMKSGITDEKIAAAKGDLADSAQETVFYFARGWQEDLDTLVERWQPQGQAAQEWKQGMFEYNSGEWIRKMRQQILQGLN